MSKRELQSEIKAHGSFIFSDGTLNPEHLLAKAHDLIIEYKLRDAAAKQLIKDIRFCFAAKNRTWAFDNDEGLLFSEMYYGRAWLKDDCGLDPYEVWNDCMLYFDTAAPKGYYFGSLEGDGACIGWFPYDGN